MDTAKLKSSSKYAWALVIALGLMSSGTTGSYSIVAGGFMPYVCGDLGIDYNMLSYYFTGTLLGLAIVVPFAGRVMDRVIGKVWLTLAACLVIAAGAAMSFYTAVWQFWISGALIGVGMAFTTGVAMSSVIDQWFMKKAGLAIGLAWAVNSVYMLIMSPTIISVIEAIGWRSAYLVLALVSAVLVLPCTILIIRYKPADKRMLPYGYDAETAALQQSQAQAQSADQASGVPFKAAVKSPSFVFCILFLCLVQITACMNQLFPTFATEVGFDPLIGGYMVSAASLCDLFLNVIVGDSCDRLGVVKALLIWVGISIVSFILLIASVGSPILAIAAAGVNDVMYVVAGTGLTCLVMTIFGSKDFSKIFAWICALGYIVGAFGMPIMTGIYGVTGNFQTVFGVCIVFDVFIALFMLAAYATGKKLPWEGMRPGENGGAGTEAETAE